MSSKDIPESYKEANKALGPVKLGLQWNKLDASEKKEFIDLDKEKAKKEVNAKTDAKAKKEEYKEDDVVPEEGEEDTQGTEDGVAEEEGAEDEDEESGDEDEENSDEDEESGEESEESGDESEEDNEEESEEDEYEKFEKTAPASKKGKGKTIASRAKRAPPSRKRSSPSSGRNAAASSSNKKHASATDKEPDVGDLKSFFLNIEEGFTYHISVKKEKTVEGEKKKRTKKAGDPDAPKKPSVYFMFMNHYREKNPNLKDKSAFNAKCSKAWAKMSAESKKPFHDNFKKAKAVYEKELAAYNAKKEKEASSGKSKK